MLATMLPAFQLPVAAASANGTDIGNENALQALGIDTTKIPDGVNLNSTDNPYGRSTVTINPVLEIFEQFMPSAILYGHNKPLNGTWNDFYTNSSMHDDKKVAIVGAYGASAAFAGNFVKASNGDRGQVVTVASGKGGVHSEYGGLYLFFSDPVNDRKGSAITLINPSQTIGNTGLKYPDGTTVNEQYDKYWDLLQNNLQVTCGDFDGDGMDEVAVYVPEQKNPRVVVYKLEIDGSFSDNASAYYLNSSKWAEVWSYSLADNWANQESVPNMVSLCSGDLNRDGVDDLSITWGTAYQPATGLKGYTPSRNIILCGGKGGRMFRNSDGTVDSLSLDLTYNGTAMVRASVAYGDINGDGVNDLIVGGQLVDDNIKNCRVDNTRFAAVYDYNGTGFSQTLAKNFDLFLKTKDSSGNETYVYPAMADHNDVFYSLPTMKADVAAVNMEGMGKPSDIYLDSLVIQYGDDGLNILAALDNNSSFNIRSNDSSGDSRYYTEYGVVSADLTGCAKQSVQVRLNYLHEAGNCPETADVKAQGVLTPQKNDNGKVESYSFSVNTLTNTYIDFASSFCALNTDEDTSYYQYSGKHGVIYSDPKVLAVLASPPYFKDLGGEGSLTELKNSQGKGDESSNEFSVHSGMYTAYEHEDEVLGKRVAGSEFEHESELGITWETSKSSEMETSISFETEAGQDSVAFYSIPIEYYDYECYIPKLDSSGKVTGYDKQVMSVNIPHQAATVVLSLEQYERIAADYSALPKIEGKVLTHKVGEPSTYPSDKSGFSNATVYSSDFKNREDEDFARVGYGDASIEQEIETKDEDSSRFESSQSIDFKYGAGLAEWTFGIVGGGDHGHGTATVSTNGNTYTGKVKNLPESAENYGYGFDWKLFTYTYTIGDNTIPVVSYLVKDVTAPPSLPSNFAQSSDLTTDHSVGLTWSYPADSAVSGFQLYKYVQYPDGSGSYKLAFVPASDIKYVDTDEAGKTIRHYQYVVDGLEDYTEYKYQIQVVRGAAPPNSIQSAVLDTRTKASEGYPAVYLNGVYETKTNTYDTSGKVNGTVSQYSLRVYPDTSSTVSVVINGSGYTYEPLYQWQKLDSQKGWTDISGATEVYYIFANSGLANEGEYRCRVNVNYQSAKGELAISAYSAPFMLNYSKRTAVVTADGFSADYAGKTVSLTLKSAQSGHTFAPSGNVTFHIKGSNYSTSKTVSLGAQDSNYAATATLNLGTGDSALNLPEGIFEITAYYQGSRVYDSLPVSNTVYYSSGNASGYFLDSDGSYTYGDGIHPTLMYVSMENGQIRCDRCSLDVSFKLVSKRLVTKSVVYYYGWDYKHNRPWHRTKTWMEYDEVEVPGSANADGSVTARATGSYTLNGYIRGIKMASKAIKIDPREITIGLKNAITGVAGSSNISQPTCKDLKVTSGALAYDDTLENLGLAVHAYNTAGQPLTMGADTEAGAYTLRPGPADSVAADYKNYTFHFATGSYILTGPKYGVTLISKPYNTDGIVGTIAITDPVVTNDDGTVLKMATTAVNGTWSKTNLFSQGTDIVLQAKPQAGYQVQSWTVQTGGQSTTTVTSSTTYVYQTDAEDATIRVEYTPSNKLIFQSANPGADDGAVTPVGDTIQSGTYVLPGYKYTFLAKPAKGYHFVKWTLSGSTDSNFKGDYDEKSGTSTTTITTENNNMTLSAVFERDNYTLTLQNHLKAVYRVDDGTGKIVEKAVTDTAAVPGGTQITVTVQDGYALKGNSVWKVNGQTVKNDGASYVFTMTENTMVSADTVQNGYQVSLAVSQPDGTDKNAVTATVNNVPTDFSQVQSVPGGAPLSFTVLPAWGCIFDHWEVNGQSKGTGETLNVAALGKNLSVLAVFKRNPDSFKVSVSNSSGGNLTYSVRYHGAGYSGNVPTDVTVAASGMNVIVYKGDSLIFTAHPSANQTLRLWTRDGNAIPNDTDKVLTLNQISGDTSVTAVFSYLKRARVDFSSESGGTIVSASSDNASFDSGADIGIGSKVVFIAKPDSGMAVDHWTLNGEYVKNSNKTTVAGDALIIGSLNAAADVKVYFTASASGGNAGMDDSYSGRTIGHDLSNCTLPSGVQAAYIGVSTLQPSSTVYNMAKKLIGNYETSNTLKNLILYDLRLFDQNHKAISGFSGTITVRMPIPDGMNGNLHVYWYDDAKGKVSDMNATQENGYLVFDTTHFSYYALAEFAKKSSPGSNVSSAGASTQTFPTGNLTSSSGTNPKTGDGSFPLVPIAVLAISECAWIVLIKDKRFKNKK